MVPGARRLGRGTSSTAAGTTPCAPAPATSSPRRQPATSSVLRRPRSPWSSGSASRREAPSTSPTWRGCSSVASSSRCSASTRPRSRPKPRRRSPRDAAAAWEPAGSSSPAARSSPRSRSAPPPTRRSRRQRVDRAREILEGLTAGVPEAYRSSPESTVLGRCRTLGVTEREATGLASPPLVAGTETAASAIARTAALLADSGQAARLSRTTGDERSALLENAVREGLRVTTPAPVIGRHITRDVTIGGRTLRAGDRALALTYVANTAPGALDLERPYLPENSSPAGSGPVATSASARRSPGPSCGTFSGPLPTPARGRSSTGRRRVRVLISTYRRLVVRRADVRTPEAQR